MDKEIWKDISGYEGDYQVSNMGNVKSFICRYGDIRILKKSYNGNGYNHISLCKNKKVKTYTIHRLVASHFIDNFENKPQVNHINGIKDDNRIENLEWCTISENIIHSYHILGNKSKGGSHGKFGGLHYSSKKVNQYDLEGNFIKTWDSLIDIKRELGIRSSSIYAYCKGRYKKAGNFKWKYINN